MRFVLKVTLEVFYLLFLRRSMVLFIGDGGSKLGAANCRVPRKKSTTKNTELQHSREIVVHSGTNLHDKIGMKFSPK